MTRLVAAMDITTRLGNRPAVISGVKDGQLYSTIYGTPYTPELLAECIEARPDLSYWTLEPNGQTEQVYFPEGN